MGHVPRSFGALLGRLEASGAVMGPSWAVEGPLVGLSGRHGTVLGASWAVGELR